MKSTIILLILVLGVIAGTAWLAQQWRLEATQYVTIKERDGDILRQQLVSEGEKNKEEIKANFRKRGVIEAARIVSETEGQGRIKIAEGDLKRTELGSVQGLVIQECILTPQQGTVAAEQQFFTDSKNENLSQEERQRAGIISGLLKRSSANVDMEYKEMLKAIGRGMALPPCPGDRPR